MENKDQYNQVGDTGTVPVPKPEQVTTRTPTDIKIQKLEEMIVSQHQEISKLRRDVNRLKSQVDDVISAIKNRG